MLLRDMTKPEIDRYIADCNFTDSELQYFVLRSKDCSNVAISMQMNISEAAVSKIARRVKDKIRRISE